MYSEIINLKDLRENYDADIEKLKKSITLSKKTRDHLIATKFALDRRRDDIRGKINSNEKKKCRYLNLIDITIALKLDKFSKFEAYRERPKILKLSLDISKGVLISDFKSLFLENLLVKIKEDNQFYESEIDEFKNKFILSFILSFCMRWIYCFVNSDLDLKILFFWPISLRVTRTVK